MAATVLIVDDHATFRALARRMLEAHGYEVVGEAQDGASAVAASSRLQPSVVLLDVQLPDIDGFAVAETLMTRRRSAGRRAHLQSRRVVLPPSPRRQPRARLPGEERSDRAGARGARRVARAVRRTWFIAALARGRHRARHRGRGRRGRRASIRRRRTWPRAGSCSPAACGASTSARPRGAGAARRRRRTHLVRGELLRHGRPRVPPSRAAASTPRSRPRASARRSRRPPSRWATPTRCSWRTPTAG